MYPKVVALDTDYTIYLGTLNARTWGKGRGAASLIQDNVERVSDWVVRDRTNHKHICRMYADIPNIIHDIKKNGAKLAIVARNSSKEMCDRALYYFKAKDGDGSWHSLIHLVDYDEVHSSADSKTVHFRSIKGWAQCHYTDMIFYDDNPINNTVEMMQGVTFKVSRKQKGLTWKNYQYGLNMWRRNKHIESPWLGLKLSNYSNPKLIGYSGMDDATIKLLEAGGRRHDRKEAARWGYGMYVADNPAVAKYFSEWIKGTPGFSSTTVCEIWARDEDIWDQMNKIWVPDQQYMHSHVNSGDASKIAWVQEDRDRQVAHWGVFKPYVLFSRHPNMGNNGRLRFPVPNNRRFNEMVIYPQVQEALIVIKRMSHDDLTEAIQEQKHIHYDWKLKSWNITVPQRTWEDVARKGDHLGRR